MAWLEGAEASFKSLAEQTATQDLRNNQELAEEFLEQYQVSLCFWFVCFLYKEDTIRLCIFLTSFFGWILCGASYRSQVNESD